MVPNRFAFTTVAIVATVSLALAAGGCATQQQLLDDKQSAAIQAATNRAGFEMNCPSAEGTVLSRTLLQPAIQGPLIAGQQRAEFTIGVSGCGQRREYVVICPEESDGCFAASPRQ
jgi:hypothetical protein